LKAAADRLNDGRSQARGVLPNQRYRRCRGVRRNSPIVAPATSPARGGADSVQSDDVDRPAQSAQPFFNPMCQKGIRAFGTARVWSANADGQHNQGDGCQKGRKRSAWLRWLESPASRDRRARRAP